MHNIPYGKQCIDEADIKLVVEALKGKLITQGPWIKEFEEKVSAYHNTKYAVAFCNGTAALHGAYYACGLGHGDEFITSPITFVATANAGVYMGATPVFVDMDTETYCIDISKISCAITDKTKVITPISYGGYPLETNKIREIIGDRDIKIIVDAAHGIGAKRDGHSICDFADMAMLSFHPVKHITTCEGGMILTNDQDLYEKLISFRTHGINQDKNKLSRDEGPWYYEMVDLGFNYRITDVQCALGISQFSKIDDNLIKRNRIASKYYEELKDVKWLNLPNYGFDLSWLNDNKLPETFHSYHLFPILINNKENRKRFFEYMRANNIFVQVHYLPVTMHPYYENNYGFKVGDFPNAEDFYNREVSIPLYYSLTEEEQDYVIELIRNFKC